LLHHESFCLVCLHPVAATYLGIAACGKENIIICYRYEKKKKKRRRERRDGEGDGMREGWEKEKSGMYVVLNSSISYSFTHCPSMSTGLGDYASSCSGLYLHHCSYVCRDLREEKRHPTSCL